MAPVVGVTLPFVSYGGSSLLTFFLGMGMVASVSLRKHGY
jgi:rod shape determining protein RodA